MQLVNRIAPNCSRREEIDFIIWGDYEEVISYFMSNKPTWGESSLYRLLDKVKDTDLPLLVNINWPTKESWENGRDLKKEFYDRLKGL